LKKALFILPLPPPVHGSSMVGKYIKDSDLLNDKFESKYINLTTSKTVDEIGKNPVVKVSRYFKIVLRTVVELLTFKPDIVYLAITAKGIGFYKDLPIALFVKLFSKKLVLHYHNKGVSERQHKFFDHLLYRTLFKNTKVMLLSKKLYADVAKYVNKEDIFYCPNGIPVIQNLNDVLSEKRKTPQLLFLSNLIESKGVFVLIEALKLLKDQRFLFQCNLVGGEGDISSKQLTEKVQDLNLQDCVSYLGKKFHDDKHEIFQASDIFIFPTFYHNECFPLVLLEAMQFGLPVISTKEGGIPDIVKDNETGFVIAKQNPEQLAKKIKWFIEHPDEASLMGLAGQTLFFKNYTLEVFEKRLAAILNQI
jgi:glycosyltransferase involved in cell wall biosynthesis